MREFKFRGYHLSTRTMLQEAVTGDVFRWCQDGQELAIMQYIGIKDKNGVEIYDGDNVKFQVANSTPPDKFQDTVRYSELNAQFQLGLFSFRMVYTSSLEVIGNIHQNPELIE